MARDYSKFVAVLVVFFSLLAIGGLDYVSRLALSFSFFYVVSVALAVILLGRIAGAVCSICAGGIALVDELAGGFPLNVALWNTGIRLATLLAATFLLHWWWKTRQADYVVAHHRVEPEASGHAMMLKRVLGSVGLVYVPMGILIVLYFKIPDRRMSLAFFYLLPMIAAVMLTGLNGGIVYTFCASAAFLVLKYMDGVTWGVNVWNATMRLAVLLTVALAIWTATHPKPGRTN